MGLELTDDVGALLPAIGDREKDTWGRASARRRCRRRTLVPVCKRWIVVDAPTDRKVGATNFHKLFIIARSRGDKGDS